MVTLMQVQTTWLFGSTKHKIRAEGDNCSVNNDHARAENNTIVEITGGAE